MIVRGLFAAVVLSVSIPHLAFAGEGSALNGRYAYYEADTAAKQDRGPAGDDDCRKFLSSDLYDPSLAEHLTIAPGRWDDNQDVSAVTGDVELGKRSGNVTPFTIRVESEAADGSGDGVKPARGTITQHGELALSITIKGANGKRTLHYCRVD
ncbi:hypothetical protein [Agrobacterium vitis]|uniref:hypothetical protein n=1 Tax=Agrobacterium vitis TaxID=373 RepID=UPI0008731B7C|nr:hypothetical protein [Agrobacterium vitis]MUO72937.1 hypothetical protein [Agrobacterium vitis]